MKTIERESRTRIRTVLREGFSTVYQPIADVSSGRVVGFESLSRFWDEAERPAEDWFEEAGRVGLRKDLELAAINRALAGLGSMPRDTYLSINASPDVVSSDEFAQALAGVPAGSVVVEITEHAPVVDYESLEIAVERLRARGVRLAIDDAGAGFASMAMVLRLRPDLIKLDKSLTRGLDADPRRRALVSALVDFASATSATIVAEGIETAAELEAARKLAVSYGQGFHLGRPLAEPVAIAPVCTRPRRRVLLSRGHGAARRRWGSRALRPASIMLAGALAWPAGAMAISGLRSEAPSPRAETRAVVSAPAAPSTRAVDIPTVGSSPPGALPVAVAAAKSPATRPAPAAPEASPSPGVVEGLVDGIATTVGTAVGTTVETVGATVGNTLGGVESLTTTVTRRTSTLVNRMLRGLFGRRR